jgi:hypothetical protein
MSTVSRLVYVPALVMYTISAAQALANSSRWPGTVRAGVLTSDSDVFGVHETAGHVVRGDHGWGAVLDLPEAITQ